LRSEVSVAIRPHSDLQITEKANITEMTDACVSQSLSRRVWLRDGQRKIIHVDMDAFYASVEQRDDPQLRGKPVIVAWNGNRPVVCAASYEARAFGVRSAMPAVRAERLCPAAVFVAPDFPRYRAVSHSVREIFKRHTDLIEPLSLDEAYLDVSENKTGLPTATLVARTIRQQIRQELDLTASAGVAPNKFLAKIASDWRKPDGLFVIQPDDVDTFLLPLPVGRLPGVGKVTGERLAKLGIKTVGDLRRLDVATLQEQFGQHGLRLHGLARGVDDSAVVPDRPTQSMSVEDTFERDVLLTETDPMIRSLAEMQWSASRKESRIARTVVLKPKTSEFKILTRSYTPGCPPSSCEELTDIALKLREPVDLSPRQRYRLVGVGLSNFRGRERSERRCTRQVQSAALESAQRRARHWTRRAVIFPYLLRLAAFHFAQRARWAAPIRLRAAADMVLRFLPSI
jgi:DNA polymerase-4